MPFPTKPAQTVSKTASLGRGLSLFTTDEVNRCVIKRADKIYSIDENGGNSTYLFWIIKVKDHYSNEYEWRDFSLPSNPNKRDIGLAIELHLTTNVYQLPYNTVIEDQDGKLHTVTVGDGAEGVDGTGREAIGI